MTDDDLDLTDRLRARADSVRATPDLADVERRSSDRHRRRTRAAGAALALVAVLGTVGGFALGRASNDETPAFLATGQALGDAAEGGSSDDGGEAIDLQDQLAGTDVLSPLPPVSDRTTEQGIRLVTRAGAPGDPLTAPGCATARTVRVAVTVDDLAGVVARPVVAPAGGFVGGIGVTGLAEGRPVWVVMVASAGGEITATFPDGSVDHTTPTDGIAVLAAFADPGVPVDGYLAGSVEVTNTGDGPRTITFGQDPCAGGVTDSPLDGRTPPDESVEKPPLPAPGEQPSDLEGERAAVTTAWESAYDPALSQEEKAAFQELPNVWLDANRRFQEEQPDYFDISGTVHGQVDEVVFTAPDRASVRFQLLSDDPRNTVARYQLGEAVLVDGTWRVAASTSCALIALAGVECNYDL